jgi:hypothetical protein
MAELNLLDAWFDILASYCNKWNQGEKLAYGKKFDETKDENTISLNNRNKPFCKHCNSKFSTISNRNRHEKKCIKKPIENTLVKLESDMTNTNNANNITKDTDNATLILK